MGRKLVQWLQKIFLGGAFLVPLWIASDCQGQILGPPEPIPPGLDATNYDTKENGVAEKNTENRSSAEVTFSDTSPAEKNVTSSAPVDSCPGCSSGFDWTKSRYRYQKFFWQSGFPTNPPTGPGYYSMRDWLLGNYQEAPPKSGYLRIFVNLQGFYSADFRYVDAPDYQPTILERIHRIHLGDDWLFGTGGEFRLRYNYEGNSRLLGKTNDFAVTRLRLFGDLWYRDDFRFYIEFLSAQSFNQDLPPGLSDRDYADILNLFVDLKTVTLGEDPVYVRLGRQQLLLGSQRLISPADWGNTLRTFDGARVYRRTEKFDVDLFWLRPVIPNAREMNSDDDHQNFAGLFTTYRPAKDQLFDAYYLYLNNNNDPINSVKQAVGPLVSTPYDVHTLGFRYAGKKNDWLWAFENMLQLGTQKDHSIFAGNTTTGFGYNFSKLQLNPTFWAYYDYASGSNSVSGSNTFNQLYPLSHLYLGWMDYVARSNIQDINFHMYLYPTKWITFNTQFHILNLANPRDALYNTVSIPERFDKSGRAGTNVGSILDIIINWHLGPHTDILTAYTHLFPGSFLKETGPTKNLNTLFLIYNVRW